MNGLDNRSPEWREVASVIAEGQDALNGQASLVKCFYSLQVVRVPGQPTHRHVAAAIDSKHSRVEHVIGGQHEMPPLVEYLKDADRLAQEVVNAWEINVQAGGVPPPEFKALLDKACVYRTARRLADNHRKFDVMSEQEAAQEMALRYAFAEAYKAFYEKHAGAS